MAKRPVPKKELTFYDIVTRAHADIIKAAYEARVQIDSLLEERLAAYKRICELEEDVQDIVGDSGSFDFPAPPYAVSGLSKTATSKKPKYAAVKPPVETAAKDADSADKTEAKAEEAENSPLEEKTTESVD